MCRWGRIGGCAFSPPGRVQNNPHRVNHLAPRGRPFRAQTRGWFIPAFGIPSSSATLCIGFFCPDQSMSWRPILRFLCLWQSACVCAGVGLVWGRSWGGLRCAPLVCFLRGAIVFRCRLIRFAAVCVQPLKSVRPNVLLRLRPVSILRLRLSSGADWVRWSNQLLRGATLTPRFIERVTAAGKFYDAFGLYLRVERTLRKYFEQRITVAGRTRTLGIGSYPVVDLDAARNAAIENVRLVRQGFDPVVARRFEQSVPTFAEAAYVVMDLRKRPWSSPGTLKTWVRSFECHVYPSLGSVSVAAITAPQLAVVLGPLWITHPRASRLIRHRIRQVLAWAVAMGFCPRNVAGPGLDVLLPSDDHVVAHQRSVPYADVSEALLRVQTSTSHAHTKLLFEFLVLTVVRSGEARGARWSEFDLEQSVWEIPRGRMKMRRPHRVPLSPRARRVLDLARVADARSDNLDLVFPAVGGGEISGQALSALARALQLSGTPHGFRSSFTAWAKEADVSPEVREACLAHRRRDAYDRDDAFGKRIPVMDEWAAYLEACSPRGNLIVVAR